jgi:hypothetical protein
MGATHENTSLITFVVFQGNKFLSDEFVKELRAVAAAATANDPCRTRPTTPL